MDILSQHRYVSRRQGTSEQILTASVPVTVRKGMVDLPLTHNIESLSGVSLVSTFSTTKRVVLVNNLGVHPNGGLSCHSKRSS